MGNIKVKVNGEAESKEAQELFFKMGCFWQCGRNKYLNCGLECFYILLRDLKEMSYCDVCEVEFNSKNQGYDYFKTITLQELREMATSKHDEYLDENYNLVHHKTDIEVPEGAETATISKEKRIEFWKDEGVNWWCSDDKEWEILGTLQSHINNCGHVIVWQRTPSVDVEDTVNHPTHYASGEVECIEAIEASMSAEAFKGFLKGNIIKYTWRYEQKGGAESLGKAQWYLNLLLSRVSS